MKPEILKLALLFSIAVNIAVLGVVSYHLITAGSEAELCPSSRVGSYAELALSPDQAREFDRLRSDFHAFRGESCQRMEASRTALLEEMLSEAPDRARVEELLSSMDEQQAALQRRLVEHLLAEKAVLRPDQQVAFQRLLERHITGTESDHHERSGSEEQHNEDH